ncbi:hypothetical protein GTA09_17295, partial [Rhodococcus hoagii]|nr:hypothetical protein [Prescottella equi]
MVNAPVPAIGAEPDLEILLLGSMMFAAPADARRAVSLVELDDYDKPGRRTVHSAIAGLLSAGRLHDGTAVDDEIRRQGLYTDPVRRTLLDAITCGPASNRVAPGPTRQRSSRAPTGHATSNSVSRSSKPLTPSRKETCCHCCGKLVSTPSVTPAASLSFEGRRPRERDWACLGGIRDGRRLQQVLRRCGSALRRHAASADTGVRSPRRRPRRLLPEQVNLLFGDPECGKTWVALAAAREALRLGDIGRVLVLDLDHNGPAPTVQRLLALGVDASVLADPNDSCTSNPRRWHSSAGHRRYEDLAPDVAVIDSLGELIPMFGSSSNSADDFTAVHTRVLKPLAMVGACVILIDTWRRT